MSIYDDWDDCFNFDQKRRQSANSIDTQSSLNRQFDFSAVSTSIGEAVRKLTLQS